MSGAVVPDLYSQICLVGAHENVFSYPVRAAIVAVVGSDLLYALRCDFIESCAPQKRNYVMILQELVL